MKMHKIKQKISCITACVTIVTRGAGVTFISLESLGALIASVSLVTTFVWKCKFIFRNLRIDKHWILECRVFTSYFCSQGGQSADFLSVTSFYVAAFEHQCRDITFLLVPQKSYHISLKPVFRLNIFGFFFHTRHKDISMRDEL